jgi:anaerobic ribonucleoside-triphosphate reductase activating protein
MMPESWDTAGGSTIDPIALAEECLAADEVEGITVSGGEPFDQPEAVAALLYLIKQHGRNTWVYTGYTIEALIARNEPAVDNLLSCCDVLVDGPFQEENGNILRFRGSANQRIIRLTNAISAERINSGGKARVDMTIDSNDRLVIVGIPPRGFMKTFRDKMGERGLVIKMLTHIKLQ